MRRGRSTPFAPLVLSAIAACSAAPEPQPPHIATPRKIVTVPADVLTDVDATYAALDPTGFQSYDVGRTKQLQFQASRGSDGPVGAPEPMHAAMHQTDYRLFPGPVVDGRPRGLRLDYHFYSYGGTAYVDRYGSSLSYMHDLDLGAREILEVVDAFSFARFFADGNMDVVLHVRLSEGNPPRTKSTLVRMKIKEIEDCLGRGGH